MPAAPAATYKSTSFKLLGAIQEEFRGGSERFTRRALWRFLTSPKIAVESRAYRG